MSAEDNKQVVARFVDVCQNQHDLEFADEIFHPDFANHYAPEGHPIAAATEMAGAGFQTFYGKLLRRVPRRHYGDRRATRGT